MEEQNNQFSENQEPKEEVQEAKPKEKKRISKMTIILGAVGILSIGAIITLLWWFGVFGCYHEPAPWQTTKQPTCTEDGEAIQICPICNEKNVYSLSAKGHTYGEWTKSINEDCLTNGEQQRVCSACGAVEKETVYARGYHLFGSWSEVQKATCIAEKIKERVCACGEKEIEVTPGFSSHNYVDNFCSECGKEVNSIKLSSINATVTLPDVPLDVSNSAARAHLTSLVWTTDSSRVYITFSGEKTWSYFGGSHYIDFIFKLYDSEGYLIDDFSTTVRELCVGDKFRDATISIPISSFEANKNYKLVLIIHC